MAEDFQAAICGDNWWGSSRSMLVAVGGMSPCSVGIGDLGWPLSSADEFVDIKPKSASTDSDHHNNNYNMFFQDYSTTSDHWNQSNNLLCGIEEQGGDHDDTSSYGYPLYHDPQVFNTAPSINTNSNFPTNLINDLSLSSTPNFPCNYLKKPVNSAAAFDHHFTNNNNKPFWNNNNNSSNPHHIIPHGISSLLQHNNNNNPMSQNTSLVSNFKPMNGGNCEDGEEGKKGDKQHNAMEGGAVVFKRPRIETPSPLPTFKVRKEKLGDRVTALQQLVSPFGKTDTASVLHEAIEYIKFLHDQVSVLSTPYMKSNNGIAPVQHQQVCENGREAERAKEDLRSRGLCLVPISSTFPMTNATTTADFWTPTFGGTFR